MNLTKIRNLAGVALLASLAACSGSGSCPPSDAGLTLKIDAPAQYPAGVAVTAYLTMTNTSGVDGKNLVYTVPSVTNYTGVTITPNPTGAGEDCTDIPAGKSCTFTAYIPAGSKPGSFTVDATPNGISVQSTKIAQSGKALHAGNSISVTANLGLVDVPNTQNEYYVLPSNQVVTAAVHGSTNVMLAVWIKNVGDGLNSIKLVDELGNDLNATLLDKSPSYTTNSVLTYNLSIPAGKTLQHVQALSNVCTTLNDGDNNNTACSNDADINLATQGNGILSIQPSMFNMSESYTSQVITLTNTGKGNVSSISYPAFDVPFSISDNNCASISKLAPQQSCIMTINYESTNSTSGQITPVFSYDDDNNAGTVPKNTEIVVGYIGEYKAKYAVLTISPISFSLSESHPLQRIIITNTGTANATNLILPTLAIPLKESDTTCTSSLLAVGDNCTYIVYIDYTKKQTAGRESVTFNYNNGEQSQTSSSAADWASNTPSYTLTPSEVVNLTPMTFSNNTDLEVIIDSITTDNINVTVAENGDNCTNQTIAAGTSCMLTLSPTGFTSATPVTITFHFSGGSTKSFLISANNSYVANCSLNGGRYVLVRYMWGAGDFDIAAGVSALVPSTVGFPIFDLNTFSFRSGGNCLGYSCGSRGRTINYPGSNILLQWAGDNTSQGQEDVLLDTWNMPAGTTSFNYALLGNWYGQIGSPSTMSMVFEVYADGTGWTEDEDTYTFIPSQDPITSCSSNADVTWVNPTVRPISSTAAGLVCNYNSGTIANQANNGSCQFIGNQTPQ